jgi:peptidyl-prolyl cis-trans isomerase B (cyclophilin B)
MENNKKLFIVTSIVVIILIGLLIIVKINNKGEDKMTGKVNVEMSIKNYGIIKLELDADVAPITVENFVNLVNENFYAGKTFHRIIKGFMIQGGSSDGLGYTGSDKTIKGEFTSNGVFNNISHKRGVISMARSSDPNSASSQFFIVHEDSEYLDGNYAAFGHVTEGMEVVDKIANEAKPTDNNGSIAAADQPVIEYVKII